MTARKFKYLANQNGINILERQSCGAKIQMEKAEFEVLTIDKPRENIFER